MEHIKVNFPRTREDFKNGNGEGMWVIVSDEVHALYEKDEQGYIFKGTLDNDSVYFPSLTCGTEVVFELRGKNRPVALFDGFLENYESIDSEKLERIMSLVSHMKESGGD